jgi:membrane associated rhomboid family serine protease
MGFADRAYNRSSPPGFMTEWTAVTTLIVITVGIWLANLLLFDVVPVNAILALPGDLPRRPWEVWKLFTYGFAHDSGTIWHVVMNMLAIFFFGREVEDIIGRAEFFRFYVAAIVAAGLAWLTSAQLFTPLQAGSLSLVGASGAVMAVMAVFIWHYPQMELLLFGLLPMPAWSLGLLYLGWDAYAAYAGGDRVAHVAHIGGAAFGLCYAWRAWNIGDMIAKPGWWRPRMRVVRYDDQGGDPPSRTAASSSRPRVSVEDEHLQEAVDRILEKISRSGESSLTAGERSTLTEASRRLRERNRS